MIKPHIVADKQIGKVIDKIEQSGFEIIAMKKMLFSKELAEKFYAEHQGKPFFEGLTSTISSGDLVALVLEKPNAISEWRELIGSTNPAEAAEGTIRKLYAKSIDLNAVHGADSPESAARETALVFPEMG
jgi:nucleoside-diphosphate kinase